MVYAGACYLDTILVHGEASHVAVLRGPGIDALELLLVSG